MGADEEKRRIRAQLLAARRARSTDELGAARAAVRMHVLDRCAGLRCVAGYVPLAGEPGSLELLATLSASGVEVLVPVTLADQDLDWAVWSPAGLSETRGKSAIGRAELVLVPALAVALDGTRLGRGGGSYDRALVRIATDATVAALVFAEEVLTALPRGGWDRPVDAAVTPQGWVPLRRNTGIVPEG